MKTLLLLALLLAGVSAADEHEESGGARTGPNKAVLEASAERGMKLSASAARRLGIKTFRLNGAGPYRISTKALIYSKEDIGLYRLRDGWYKHLDIEISDKEQGFVVVRATGLKAGDEVVIAGTPLLRVAELDVLGGEETDHGH